VRERRAVGKLGSSMKHDFQSQAGQDQFVCALVAHEGGAPGTFLDVGCNNPVTINNTYVLEQLGWLGVLIDCEPSWHTLIMHHRKSPFVCADASHLDWRKLVVDAGFSLTLPIDYLSFDLDASGFTVLQAMPLKELRFRIMTIEHDAYRFGDANRDAMRARLLGLGYDLLCPDVMNDGCRFEDWWVDPKKVDMTTAERFRTTGATPWQNIVSR
jgi:hypothetical protein